MEVYSSIQLKAKSKSSISNSNTITVSITDTDSAGRIMLDPDQTLSDPSPTPSVSTSLSIYQYQFQYRDPGLGDLLLIDHGPALPLRGSACVNQTVCLRSRARRDSQFGLKLSDVTKVAVKFKAGAWANVSTTRLVHAAYFKFYFSL